ncbi:hypothetical protein SESBI_04587 [Sesbania bispinosa]|nr:hypothetical protein SESBI_04587 [Sesbania bispinosa]
MKKNIGGCTMVKCGLSKQIENFNNHKGWRYLRHDEMQNHSFQRPQEDGGC